MSALLTVKQWKQPDHFKTIEYFCVTALTTGGYLLFLTTKYHPDSTRYFYESTNRVATARGDIKIYKSLNAVINDIEEINSSEANEGDTDKKPTFFQL